jgi:hypothetical protein
LSTQSPPRPSGAPESDLELQEIVEQGRRPDRWYPVVAFGVVAGVVVAVSILAHSYLPAMHTGHRARILGEGWVRSFTWWDGWWYSGIARRGYWSFSTYRQSPVAFFPAYPLLMRGIGSWTGQGPMVAGVGITVASGLGSAVLFHRWCSSRLQAGVARVCVLVLLLSPFAFYLMGTVYADALFLFLALGAFVALESERPWLAALAAAVATATRPVGPALIVGLWAVAVQQRRWNPRLLLAPLGLVAYCVYLAARFGHPFAFVDVSGAGGWGQSPGPHTWLKLQWLTALARAPWFDGRHGHLVGNALITVAAVALLPAVLRLFGWGYGVFAGAIVVVAALSTKDFVGMGRYMLAAFPCFAAAGDGLARKPRLRWACLAASAVVLLTLAQLHARGTIIS